jgi:AraC-like DNA-binding protein
MAADVAERRSNASRASLSDTLSFLTSWRIELAADLLPLSSAFKRVRGISPQDHRALVTV